MAPMSHEPEPLVIDVDTGIDDALALLNACAAAANIVGIDGERLFGEACFALVR